MLKNWVSPPRDAYLIHKVNFILEDKVGYKAYRSRLFQRIWDTRTCILLVYIPPTCQYFADRVKSVLAMMPEFWRQHDQDKH